MISFREKFGEKPYNPKLGFSPFLLFLYNQTEV